MKGEFLVGVPIVNGISEDGRCYRLLATKNSDILIVNPDGIFKVHEQDTSIQHLREAKANGDGCRS